MTTHQTCSMETLRVAAEVPARTLRSWIRRGVLPKPIGRGRASRYDERHLLCAKVARTLRAEQLPVAAVRRRIAGLSEAELRGLLPAAAPKLADDGVPEPPPAPRYPAVTWHSVALTDGLVLLVDTSRGPLPGRIAGEIHRHYGAR